MRTNCGYPVRRCYMNSVIQQLFMQPQLRAHLLAAYPVPKDQAKEDMFAQLQVSLPRAVIQQGGAVTGEMLVVNIWLLF